MGWFNCPAGVDWSGHVMDVLVGSLCTSVFVDGVWVSILLVYMDMIEHVVFCFFASLSLLMRKALSLDLRPMGPPAAAGRAHHSTRIRVWRR